MQIIKRGAEAILTLSEWHGRKVVIKNRITKGYRNKVLDEKLRSERIKIEVNLMSRARQAGVCVPLIYDIDIGGNRIIMEYIDGGQIKEILNNTSKRRRNVLCKSIGSMVARLHSNDIVHGDLTTSNILLHNDNRLYVIDFSLGEKSGEIEKKGVDLHLLKEAFQSAHSTIMDTFQIVLDTYCKEYPGGRDVVKKIEEIERRGRYTS